MDPVLLEIQRERVQEIRKSLPNFEYDRKGDIHPNDKTPREFR